jgi:hypothetical protein
MRAESVTDSDLPAFVFYGGSLFRFSLQTTRSFRIICISCLLASIAPSSSIAQ